MDIKQMYREIVNDHNLHPYHKHDLISPSVKLRGVNPSCGDDINLQLKIENGVIVDGSYNGSGCAISQASADMMLDLIIGQTEEEAKRLGDIFMRMIKGQATPEEIEELDEAAALENVSHMPARVKCAQLGWRTLGEVLESEENSSAE
ncbi:MAG: SUF system NifU family Fe-S cluster assembly protein [Lachnospiraceae bacterium]|nr:SUF system NifU family Fe-S cluster assembly protein [Lachnospiraceae bacterium]